MYHIKRDKRSEQSSKWIIDALAELMRRKEFRDISVVELAAQAGVGRATFYRNFDSIEDVLRLECDEAFAALGASFADYYRTVEGTTSKTNFIKPFLQYWDSRTELIERLIQANQIEFINEAIMRLIHFFLSRQLVVDSETWNRLDYFVAKRAGEALNVLVLWIKNKKDISADDLAELITLQTEKSSNLTLEV